MEFPRPNRTGTMQFGQLSLKRCRYGWMLYTGPYIGKCFDLYGQYSESEVDLMRAFLRAGDTVIDVGANIGDLTVPLSQIVGPPGRVYAVESHPDTFNVLCANLALNGIRNAKPMNAFVAAVEQRDARDDVGPSQFLSKAWATPSMPLDSLELDACQLIKIDVDGGELDVLRSGEMQIERFRPILYFENDVREKSAKLLEFARDVLGYDLYFHPAPIFSEDNFFGNRTNHWAPAEIKSWMIVGLPSERELRINLKPVTSSDEWWE
jgi:FkbM family methyltransferase